MFFDAISGNTSLKAQLFAPSGVLVLDNNTNSDWGAFNLKETGTYRLLIDGNGATTGNYSFILKDRTQSTEITFGNSIIGQLNPGNIVDLYQLTGSPGQRLNFDLSAATWIGANWIFYDPNGTPIKVPSANNPDFNVTFGAAGLYTLAIVGNSINPVNYSLSVTDISVAPLPNTGVGVIQSGTLNAGQVIDYDFTANAGTLMILDGQAPFNNSQIRARLLNPDGKYVFTDHEVRLDRGPILLEQTGNYKLQTFGYYSYTTGEYQFNLLELPKNLSTPNLNYLEIGSEVSGNLDALQNKVYTFDGVKGQQIIFNAMIGENVRASLYDSNGNTVFSQSNFQWNGDRGSFSLTQNGLYYLVIANDQSASRNYSFQLLDMATAPEITYSLPKVGSLENGQTSQFFKLQAQAGDRLYFDSISSSTPGNDPGNYRWKLFGSGNNQLFDIEQRYDTEIVIAETGEYYLYIQGGPSTGKIDYNFRVLRHEKVTADVITSGIGETASNSSNSLGLFSVKLGVEDAQGASAVQEFNIKLWPDPDNASPIIISTPDTRFGLADKIYQYQLKSLDPDGDPLVYRLLDAPLGALINNDTGEIIWFPETTVTPGSTVNFKVEVSDRRGGKDIQSFAVDIYSALGKIQGAVFEDVNRNGFRDTTLVNGASPDIIFAIDVSGSAGERTVDWTKTDLKDFANGSYSILDMELATAIALSEQLVLQGRGDSAKISVVLWGSQASLLDMNPSEPGIQLYTTALADNNANGIADIKEVLNFISPGGGTDFTSGLIAAKGIIDSLPGDPNLIFMSDGFGNVDETVIAEIRAAGINVTAFGIGSGSSMTQLRKVDPNAIQLKDVNELIDIFSGWDSRYSTEPFLENITVYLDLNNNAIFDADEPWQLTKEDISNSILGETKYYYTFNNLLPETYIVRQVVPSGYTQTAPSSDSFVDTVTVAGESTFSHLFALHKVATPPNQDPVFRTTAPIPTLSVGEELIYRANASDPNANPLTYDLTLAPSGMLINKETGTLIWSPKANQAGIFNVILRVQDGQGGMALQAFQGTVLPENHEPVFTSTTPTANPQVGKTFRYQAQALDSDGDTLIYSLLTGAPSGITINSTTGLVTWTPTAAQLGTQEFSIKVIDGKGGEGLQKVSLVVNTAAPNLAPVITSTPRTQTRLGNSYYYKLEATDPDGDILTYSLQTAPTGMNITSDGVITWTPTAAQFGSQPVVINVSDGSSTQTQSFNLNVSNTAANYAPSITSAPDLITNIERTYEYNLTGSDPDGDLLLWSLDAAPEGMVIDAQRGTLRWQPLSNQIGEHNVKVRLTDAWGSFVGQEFTLTVTGTNIPSAIVSNPITRAAQNQLYTYTVVATDPENDPLTFSLGRKPAGMTIDDNGTIRWTPQASQIGSQQVEVFARDAQGAVTTQTYAIEVGATAINTAPSITSTPVYLAAVGSPYSYQVQATDPDAGDRLTYQLLSVPAGVTGISIDSTTGLLTWANPVAGNYKIVVGAVDAAGLGAAQGFALTARVNNAPVIRSTPMLTATPGSTYSYDVIASDADGDRLSYTLDQASRDLGMTLDTLGRLRWTPTTNNVGSHTVVITVNDANGGTGQQEYNLSVAADTEAPKVRLIANYDLVNLGESITFQARATDNIKVAGLRLLIDGTAVVLDSNGMATFKPTTAGTITAKAIATDSAGNISEATFSVAVIDTSDVNAPDVSLDLSAITGGLITAPVDIKGSISDDGSLDYYRLLVAPVAGGEFKEIVFVDNPTAIADGVLGKFDPSLLQNDSYILRLEVADNGGHISYVDEVIDVAGDLKLGNFRLSFTDLTVPVTGIPITLTRTYDTLTSGSTDDFGYGWRMEFRDTDLRTSLRPPSEDSQLVGYQNPFKNGTKVYITLPGGKREAFTFKAKQVEQVDGGSLLYFSKYFYQPEFVADKGVTNTLTVESNFITRQQDSDLFYGFQGNPYNPADPLFGGKYKLTTKEGVVYEIDAATGDLLTVTDTNGNKLTYTDADITSSTGQKITFGRDAQGRIATVTDPAGKQIHYQYNAQDDLVSVTDREGNTTRMEYDEQRSHYLDKIIDPLGRTGVKNEYGDDGRLKEIIDVNGKAVEMSYDPNNSRQVVKDTRGYSTTYIYDERGNVLQEIDAKGGITTRTYDNDNNLLSETDADGVVTKYTYDDRDNVLTIEDSVGKVIRTTYNQRGQALSITSPTGLTVFSEYDSRGNLTKSTDADGLVTTYKYNQFGRLIQQVSPDGQVMQYGYDEFGNPNNLVDSRGNVVASVYDANGRVKDVTAKVITDQGVQNLTTSYIYDKNGRTTQVTDQYGNVRKTEYNTLGQITFTEDSLGNRTHYFYDNKGRLTDVILPDNTPDNPNDNPKTNTKYDNAGNVIEATSATGLTTRYVYDELGRLSETILPDQTPNDPNDNPKIITKYTAAGRLKEEIDIFGNSSRYWYDDLGRLEREQDVLGNYSTYTYNRGGQIETVTDAKNRTTRFVYDDNARAKETIFFDGSKNQVTYDELSRLKTETNELGQTTSYEYDEYGQVKAVINALNERTEYAYDQRGKLAQVTDALQHFTKLEYDKYGRQVATIAHTGERSEVEYDRYSRVKSETDANQHKKQYFYNNLSQLTTVELADATRTNYTYDIYGRLTAVEDANENVTQYEYDLFNRQVATVLPMGQRKQTDYNNLGQVESYKDFNSDIINYAYDQYGRLDTKSFSNPSMAAVSYTYDPITSQIATVTDGRGVTRYGYDNYDRLASITNPDGQAIGYGYDLLGNLTSQTTSAGTVNYIYDALNRLDQVIVAGRTLTDYDYNAVGSLIRTTNANGTVENRQYNERNQLKYLDDRDSAGNIISSYSYTLDAVGYRTQVVENSGRVVNYTYDNLDRLTQEKITDSTNGNRTIDYTFDLVGNRLSRTDSAEGLTTYVYDGNNRLTSLSQASKVTQFTYDSNGSMKSRSDETQTVTYDWINDGENRLVGVTTTNTNGTSHQQYIYDASGDRVASIADGVRTNYLVDPMRGVSQVLLEYDTNGQVTAEYTYGLGLIKSDRSGNENYYHTDGLGSTRVLTNAIGQVVDNYTYDAYGRLLFSTGTAENSYQFAGEQRDSQTGLDYLRARYYDADLGRFISKDAFAGFMDDPMSQHDYQYAHANPVNFTDPTGYFTLTEILTGIGITGLFAGLGIGAANLIGSYASGASGEDLLNLTDQWVAGFANTVSFGGSTHVRRWLYGEVAEQNHSGFMWNMGQLAGTGAAMILGAATPEKLTFSMGRSKWIATTYDAIGTGIGAWQTGTHIRQGQLEWSDAFNLAPFAPFAFKTTKQFLGAAMDANGTLRRWGQMQVTSYLQNRYRSYKAGWTSETGAVNLPIFRGTDRYLENSIFEESGYILSDAAQTRYMENGGNIQDAIEHAKSVHQEWLKIWGNENDFAQVHGLYGVELPRDFKLDKTLISVTSESKVVNTFGSTIYQGSVPKSILIPQTLPDAGESEYLIRYGTNALRRL
ncbi:putative Ig domain-containing protein [Nostoc sp. CCY 9925]|uniref:putative Ig domain-containing protein n=1 Tax=Nostoc sp. CCY 9925 TaxID=3103865 RepID=UPI0039C5DC8F